MPNKYSLYSKLLQDTKECDSYFQKKTKECDFSFESGQALRIIFFFRWREYTVSKYIIKTNTSKKKSKHLIF
jgi:hypothetical protein